MSTDSSRADKENNCCDASHHGHESRCKRIRLAKATEQERPTLKNITHLANSQRIKVTVQKKHSGQPSQTIDPLLQQGPQRLPLSKPIEAIKAKRSDDLALIQKWSELHEQVYDYGSEIEESLRYLQEIYPIEYGRLSDDSAVTPSMRTVLVDWLVEVVDDFELKPVTLHLAVHYIDRYFGVKVVQRHFLQLLGVAALLVASKFEELHPCKCQELLDVCNNVYSLDQLHLMERKVITALDFGLHSATIHAFVHTELQRLAWAKQSVARATDFLMELCLSNYEMCKYKYSEIAQAITLVALECYDLRNAPAYSHRVENRFLLDAIRGMLRTESGYYDKVPGIVAKHSAIQHDLVATAMQKPYR